MHHSTNRAPFLRQVVSREVSSDPQVRIAVVITVIVTSFRSGLSNYSGLTEPKQAPEQGLLKPTAVLQLHSDVLY
jgi:hypothetical protein